MNISKLIEELTNLKEKYGECEVKYLDIDDSLKTKEIKDIDNFYICPPTKTIELMKEREEIKNENCN